MSAPPRSVRPNVTGVTEALDGYLAHHGENSHRPPLRYLRRKPGRGLVAVFGPGDGGDIYTVTVAEASLAGDSGEGNAPAPAVQQFPTDPLLPDLDVVMAPAEHPSLRAVLERTARQAAALPADWALVDVAAQPVRYKPGDRCVLRYRLRFADPTAPGGRADAARTCTLIAKLYRESPEAQVAADLLSRLHEGAGAPWTARSLGVAPGLSLALAEDLGGSRDVVPTRSGLDVVHPGAEEAVDVVRSAARALAELHTCGLETRTLSRRTGEDEAGKAAKRARLLERYVPELAGEIRQVAAALCATLAGLPDHTMRPGHGSYKPSQLLVRDGAVFLVDFDQFCLTDPALDVGYFLAYLRPAGLWYHRAGRREWFETAASAFLTSYLERVAERGEPEATRAGIVGREPVFEAALLLKIAARRANRLHSPRVGEVSGVLDEISRSLAAARPSA